jgi:hypothetical protein
MADGLIRVDLLVLDERGYLPFAGSGGQSLFLCVIRLYEPTPMIVTTNLAFAGLSTGLSDAPLRYSRDRQQQLALQEPPLTTTALPAISAPSKMRHSSH